MLEEAQSLVLSAPVYSLKFAHITDPMLLSDLDYDPLHNDA